MIKKLTSLIKQDEDMYVALFPEFDIASQGETPQLAQENLRESVQLFFECASSEEIAARTMSETIISQFEVTVG